ncbi:bifunctional 2-polyprenyl-6-hydroxyphenol methylase/3-demethylubiquinol 3-O-methyltransferase UbiG [Paenibacillus sp. S150]|uniref:class I SAM-dependent methyltransferase n=1 Tax=Paenibacillus sp. S150 TaxID=2749826 RepID=UPI001C58801F|nr:class I SAM-dependent methyltransferase [Paenibacillus sp. S150]MBW4085005.1 class I SAM-dependent methyltransferase [Paenibacillus sp. S150]
MSQYWSTRFAREGMIWGDQPSPSALRAKVRFLEHGVKSVLVPGAGYGRNTKAFSSELDTYGVELSRAALELAAEWDVRTRFIEGSALEPQSDIAADAVYCYDVLHLFLAEERRRLIAASLAQLRPGGLLYFTGFSDEDPNNGRGSLLEPGTFEYKAGKYAHFFSDADLRGHFAMAEIMETGTFTESLHSPRGDSHNYILRYILARKAL